MVLIPFVFFLFRLFKTLLGLRRSPTLATSNWMGRGKEELLLCRLWLLLKIATPI